MVAAQGFYSRHHFATNNVPFALLAYPDINLAFVSKFQSLSVASLHL